MAIVTFWNNSRGRTGQTSSAIAISTYLATQRNLKILLISTGCGDIKIKRAYGYHSKNEIAKEIMMQEDSNIDSGIQGLYKRVLSNRLTAESIRNYANTIYNERLDALEGIDYNSSLDYEDMYQYYKDIIDAANQVYNIVFVDLNHGINNQETKIILEKSDIIIVNLEQDINEIKKFDELRFEEPLFLEKNILLLLNRYDKYSKYNSKNISRLLKIKPDVLAVPYNTSFSEAMQEGNVDGFFLNPVFKMAQDFDKNEIFIDELQNDIDTIEYKLKELHIRK